MSFMFLGKLKFASQYLKLLSDPNSLENVVKINETLSGLANEEQKLQMVTDFKSKTLGANALVERPRLGKIDLQELNSLPANTLGKTYVEFLKQRNLNPNDLPDFDPNNKADDFDFARAHFFETHDVWHVVTGFDTDLAGELGLQAFYMTQFPARMALVLFSSVLLSQIQEPIENSRKILAEMARGHNLGQKAQGLVGRDWKLDWQRDLNEIRQELGLFRE